MTPTSSERLLSMIFYEGPWERLAFRFAKIPWLHDFCDARDIAWHDWYVTTGLKPHARWKRRGR